MKLKNKLLPLVGIGAACAAVTPIALTSCKNNNGLVDLASLYHSKYNDLPKVQDYSADEANKLYFQAVKDDNGIFADDIYWSISLANNLYYSNPNAGKHLSIEDATDNTGAVVSNQTTPAQQMVAERQTTNFYFNGGDSELERKLIKLLLQGGNSLYIENVKTDNEKIDIKSITKKTITPTDAKVAGESYDVWLLSFSRQFEVQWDETEYIADDDGDLTGETIATTNKRVGTIEYTNIPFRLQYNLGVLKEHNTPDLQLLTNSNIDDEDTLLTNIGIELWKIGIDTRTYTTKDNKEANLIDYIIADEENESSMKISSDYTQESSDKKAWGEETTDSWNYKFDLTIDSEMGLSEFITLYSLTDEQEEQIQFLGSSHYMWNITETI